MTLRSAVYVLVADLFFAARVVKTVQNWGLEVKTFDMAERLIQAAEEKEPIVVLLDCQGLEKEAFRVLDAFRAHPRLSKIPRVGYLPQGERDLKRQMRDAGCEQLYAKSEVTKELGNILARYTHGLSSRF